MTDNTKNTDGITHHLNTEYKRAWEDAPISTITVTIIFE